MFTSLSYLHGAKVTARDGDIGKVKEALFDDRSWVLRYLVVETGNWLQDRQVLISPYAVQHPVGHDKHLHLSLSQQQVRDSPPVDTHLPVSRQQERELLTHYGYPSYWEGDALWGMGATPGAEHRLLSMEHQAANRAMLDRDATNNQDSHLRSSTEVSGYEIQATDHVIGKVDDLVIDDANWALRYLVVETSSWWQGGRKVLIGMNWADRIDAQAKKFHVKLSREEVKNSPPFDDVASIHREYELLLHRKVKRVGYWV